MSQGHAPSSPVRIAMIGCGGYAGVHARRLKAVPECRVVALMDVSAEQLERFRAKHFPGEPGEAGEAPATFTDMEEMYAQAKPDGVVVCTPHTMHYEHGDIALANGCHVLMQKPMVTSSEQAKDLAAKVEAARRVFIIGYNTPFTAAHAYLRELIRSKQLGRLETVTGWIYQDWKRLTTGTWRQKAALSGGGMLYDTGAHLFNALLWAVEQPVAEVFAVCEDFGAPVEINGAALIRLTDGVIASLLINGDCAELDAGMHFCFEDGRVEVDAWGGSLIRVRRRGEGELKDLPLGEDTNPDRNFIDTILGRAEPRTTPKHGVLQSELMDAIYESARTGKPVSVGR